MPIRQVICCSEMMRNRFFHPLERCMREGTRDWQKDEKVLPLFGGTSDSGKKVRQDSTAHSRCYFVRQHREEAPPPSGVCYRPALRNRRGAGVLLRFPAWRPLIRERAGGSEQDRKGAAVGCSGNTPHRAASKAGLPRSVQRLGMAGWRGKLWSG